MVSYVCRRFGALVLISSLGASGCDSELYHDLSERRVNEALLLLKQSGVRADKRLEQRGTATRPSSYALVVPRADELRALSLLGQRGLPRLAERAPSQSSSKLLFSPAEQHAESAEQLSASLSETLERLPEVAEARVHLALPVPEPLSPLGTPRPTASVLLKLRGALSIQPGEVAQLVAHAVPGLEVQDVAVVRAAAPAEPPAAGQAPMVAVGPMVVAPESRTLAIGLFGLVVALSALCVTLARLAWPRRQPPLPRGPLTAGASVLR